MSASNKYFGTDGVRGFVGRAPITPDFLLKLAWAAGTVLSPQPGGKVLIGKDTRISGYLVESAMEAGLAAAGVTSHLLGPMPTPAVAYLTRTFHAQAGIMLSASHNPYHDNGVKFFAADGRKLPDKLEQAIEAQLEKPMTTVDPVRLGRAKRLHDAPGRYIEFCKSTIPSRVYLDGLKIVLDCANGATYHIAGNVMTELGANVTTINVEPNGYNINAACGSTSPAQLQTVVQEQGADLGIAFDGDGDRVIMVDNRGDVVDGDEILFIIAKHFQSHNRLNGGVVGTLMSNFGLERTLTEMNIPFVRAKVGDRHVLQELDQRQWKLGGESSGHILCLDANTTGDGIVSALQVLTAMWAAKQPLHELKATMHKMPQIMLNVPSPRSHDVIEYQTVQAALEEAQHCLQNSGRVLLRPSGTEPLIRVMVEGENERQVQQLAEQLADAVKEAVQALT